MYGDYELLSVCEYFDNVNDRGREMAVYELILRSPEVSEMVAYEQLYFDVVNYYRWEKQYLNAVQWCYALIAFSEQHDGGMDRVNHRLDLADIFLDKGEFDLGLKLYTQLLRVDGGIPGSITGWDWCCQKQAWFLSYRSLKPGFETGCPKRPGGVEGSV